VNPDTITFSLIGLWLGSEAARMGVEVALPVLPEIGSELYFHMLKEWLRDCDQCHSDHSFAPKEKALPRRVLDLQSLESPDKLRLYESNGEDGKYIALSHCWGQSKDKRPLSTTKGNKEAHFTSMNFDDLPKTFRDAVVVTRKLGIRYLWIDSLCIIQDDESDWESESRHMENIFANAYCTIAATSAENSWDGFLSRIWISNAAKIEDKSADPPVSIYVSEFGEFGGDFGIDVIRGVLNQRAWVLQERALSPRIIHFTGIQTYWECGSVVRSENLIQRVK
jgi:hypothetical protein